MSLNSNALAGAQDLVLPLLASADGTAPPPRSSERYANLVKFQSELEFVQCLANPLYLYELHTQKYFQDEKFIKYIEYLQYWHDKEYVRFISYPTCLVYLTLLQRPAFREAISNPAYISELMRVGARHHETWRVEKPPNHLSTTQSVPPTQPTSADETKPTPSSPVAATDRPPHNVSSPIGLTDGPILPTTTAGPV